MLLVTTADDRAWREVDQPLLLGRWCGSAPETPCVPYHWNDRERAASDFHYLRGTFEEILQYLASELNRIHSLEYSPRFWRIVVGPWLSAFIDVVFDRYQSILAARDGGSVTSTMLPSVAQYHWANVPVEEFYDTAYSDTFNFDLFGRIIRFLKPFPYCESSIPLDTVPSLKSYPSKSCLPRKILVWLLNTTFPHRRYAVTSEVFRKTESIGLHFALREIPFIGPAPISIPALPVQRSLRESFTPASSHDEFSTLVVHLMPEYLPTIYLEGFAWLAEETISEYPRSTKAIVTSGGLFADEPFKYWVARQVENGAKLINVQHGGLYGTNAWCSHEYNEINSADYFFSWGWTTHDPKILPVDAPKLIGIRKRMAPTPQGNLLMVLNSAPRYSYRHASWPIGEQFLSYLEDQVNFIRALCPNAQQKLVVRPYPLNRGWDVEHILRSKIPEIQLRASPSMYEQLKQSSLFIGTCNITTYLEALAADFPTILFWNPKHWETRPEAAPYFALLRESGILFDSPQSAAESINTHLWDISGWWAHPKRQEARKEFVDRFARSTTTWLSNWTGALRGVLP